MLRLGAVSSPAATWSSTAAVGFDQRNDDVGPEPGQPLALGELRHERTARTTQDRITARAGSQPRARRACRRHDRKRRGLLVASDTQPGMKGLPVARPQKGKRTCVLPAPMRASHVDLGQGPREEEPRLAWSGSLSTYLRARAAADQAPPSTARKPDPNWRAMLFAAAAAVLCCCTSPWNRGLGLSNYASDLGWSYGDSNPRPLACHTAATRPPASIAAGHRPRGSARVPRNPGRLLYFRAVPSRASIRTD